MSVTSVLNAAEFIDVFDTAAVFAGWMSTPFD
jgi:hypothetical protein